MFGNFFSHLSPRILVLFPLVSGILGDCGPPPVLKYAKPYDAIKSSYKPFESVPYGCLPGYEENQTKTYIAVCFPDTGWNRMEEFCERGCETPRETRFTIVDDHDDIFFYPVGSVVHHICHRSAEHILGHPKRPAITCLSNYTWSPIPVFCKGKSCGDPGKPENGDRIVLMDFLLRAKVNFICNKGYQLIGSPTSQCLPRGLFNNTVVWKPKPPICFRPTCPPPPQIMNGNYTGGKNGNFSLNSTVTYICGPGFSLLGDDPLHCVTEDNTTGIWRGSVPECKGDCPTPTLPPHSSPREGGDLAETYAIGSSLILKCIPGYEYIPGATRSIQCLSTSQWSAVPKLCRGRRCPTPSIDNGKIVSSNELRLGDQVTFACDYGFRMIGDSTIRCVLIGGGVNWNRDVPFCQRIPCERPPRISNGMYDADPSDEYNSGSTVRYRCNADYSLIGQSTITCIVAENGLDGKWNPPPPECKKVKCHRPSIENGKVVNLWQASYTYENSISFECNPGYTLEGSSLVKCDGNSNWSPPVPHCVEGEVHIPTKPDRPTSPAVPPTPSTPKDETEGTGKTIGIAFGAVLAAIVLAALIFVAVKRFCFQGKANSHPASADTYRVVSKKDMPLKENQTKD